MSSFGCSHNDYSSQELHNMDFSRKLGSPMRFFEQVRFFSAVATWEGVVIRIHRAKKTNENTNPIPGANGREDYLLQFEKHTRKHMGTIGREQCDPDLRRELLVT
jgi:hypothetical protein